MIKFILAVIAMIFVGLAAYVYMNPKETHAPVAKVAQKTERSIVKKDAPSVQKETVSAKAEVVSAEKRVVNASVTDSQVDESEIALMDDGNYAPEVNQTSDELLSDKELMDIEKQILKNTELAPAPEPIPNDDFAREAEKGIEVGSYDPMKNPTSDASLSDSDLKDIEANLPEQQSADIQPIENDDFARMAESSEKIK